MRVIGGTARGRVLRAPDVPGLRPTSDRVREAMFDILEARGLVEGATVLDLYAGSGALGIEALSRGAASCTFVDSDRRAIAAIESNLASVGLAGAAARAVRSDVIAYLGSGPPGVDLALVDPPYAFATWSELLDALPATTALLEHGRPVEVDGPFHILRNYRYGGTLVTLATRHSTDKDPA